MRVPIASAAIALALLAVPSGASGATISVDPDVRCYREQQTVFLNAQGYTPNGFVDFTRDGELVERLQANSAGEIQANLTLPGLMSGQRPLTYVGQDAQNAAVRAEVSLLTTATDVRVRPVRGAPNRRLRIQGRGFFGSSRTVWAHVTRMRGDRRAARPARTVRIGRVRGACRRVEARRRLFRRNPAPGRYRVQFDTFRRYKPNRKVEYDGLTVTILSPASGR